MQPHPDDFASRYGIAAARLLALIEDACAAAPDWPRGVAWAVKAALALLASEPDLARLLLLEPYEAGRPAQLRHEATLDRLGELLRAGRQATDSGPMPEAVEQGLVGAISFIVSRPLRNSEPDLLPALGPELTALILTPYLGREAAERIAFGS